MFLYLVFLREIFACCGGGCEYEPGDKILTVRGASRMKDDNVLLHIRENSLYQRHDLLVWQISDLVLSMMILDSVLHYAEY